MVRHRQDGFSLMELVIAMTIMAVLITVGFKLQQRHADTAKYLKTQEILKNIEEGLGTYYLKHGMYPELSTWEALVDNNGPLVKGDHIPASMPAKDPWDQSYEGVSAKRTYTLKTLGDPNNVEEHPALSKSPGRYADATPAPATGTSK